MSAVLASLPWWVLPACAALILVATHTYLGLHVISRNVFFVDLALAQIAALGSTVAYLYGFEMGDSVTYDVSLLFAVGGAWFFSVARVRDNRVPQEAIIGLAFAVASACAILLSTQNPHGAEHLRDMMAGSILVVSPREVSHAAWLYGLIGIFHFIFRRPLLLVSMDREAARRAGMRVALWDFLFYLSFALVITSSVRIAGVLLVFILLIAPAMAGAMFANGIRGRLLIGWASGALATLGGLVVSYRMDWPPAPAISCIFAGLLLGASVISSIVYAQHRSFAVLRLAATALVLSGVLVGLTSFLRDRVARLPKSTSAAIADAGSSGTEHNHGKPEHESGGSRADLIAALGDEHDNVRARAAEELGKLGDPALVPALATALHDRSSAVKEKAAAALGALGRAEAIPALSAALAAAEADEWVDLREAEALVLCGGAQGMTALLTLAASADAKLVRIEALGHARAFLGRPALGVDDDAAIAGALEETRREWQRIAPHAQWDAATHRFTAPPIAEQAAP